MYIYAVMVPLPDLQLTTQEAEKDIYRELGTEGM